MIRGEEARVVTIPTQLDPAFESIEWHGDPAASGYRHRAWVVSLKGEPAHLVAYESGHWGLGLPRTQYQYVATGDAPDLVGARRAVFDAWHRLRDRAETKRHAP